MNVYQSCRMCLCNEPPNVIDGETNITEEVEELFGFKITETDECSRKICFQCFNRVVDFSVFKKKVISNQTLIKSYLKCRATATAMVPKEEIVIIDDDDEVPCEPPPLLTKEISVSTHSITGNLPNIQPNNVTPAQIESDEDIPLAVCFHNSTLANKETTNDLSRVAVVNENNNDKTNESVTTEINHEDSRIPGKRSKSKQPPEANVVKRRKTVNGKKNPKHASKQSLEMIKYNKLESVAILNTNNLFVNLSRCDKTSSNTNSHITTGPKKNNLLHEILSIKKLAIEPLKLSPEKADMSIAESVASLENICKVVKQKSTQVVQQPNKSVIVNNLTAANQLGHVKQQVLVTLSNPNASIINTNMVVSTLASIQYHPQNATLQYTAAGNMIIQTANAPLQPNLSQSIHIRHNPINMQHSIQPAKIVETRSLPPNAWASIPVPAKSLKILSPFELNAKVPTPHSTPSPPGIPLNNHMPAQNSQIVAGRRLFSISVSVKNGILRFAVLDSQTQAPIDMTTLSLQEKDDIKMCLISNTTNWNNFLNACQNNRLETNTIQLIRDIFRTNLPHDLLRSLTNIF